MALDPELTHRFRADLLALCDMDGARLGVAYSGGPDSLALLLLAQEALHGQVEAATVDHGLRPESADEAALAAENCRQLGVHHEVLKVEVARGNLQSEARRARYAALTDWARRRGLSYILTAHHADDQAETFLMRANRGSGLFGLAGVRSIAPTSEDEIVIVRPLLSWRRSELGDLVETSGLPSVDDPSNEDDRFDRVQMRKALVNTGFIDVQGLANSAQNLSALEDDIAGLVLEEWASTVEESGNGYRYRPFARSIIERPVFWGEVLRVIGEDLGSPLTRRDAAQMIESLLVGKPVNIAGVQASAARVDGEVLWTFAPENPRRTG